LTTRLNGLDTAITNLHRAREDDKTQLTKHLTVLGAQATALRKPVEATSEATSRVSSLLSTSQTRGSWGEFELRHLVEMTGMTEHISFDFQRSGYGDDARGRPTS
jgi:DNA recombination protein RmuC